MWIFLHCHVRNCIFTKHKEELERTDERLNYMAVPAAIMEFEKIEIIKYTDQGSCVRTG